MYRPVATPVISVNPNKYWDQGLFDEPHTYSMRKRTVSPTIKRPKRTVRQKRLEAFNARLKSFRAAAEFANRLGYPLRLHVTICWFACSIGECREGHLLHLPEPARCKALKDKVSRLARKLGFRACFLFARANGRKHGVHLHLALGWPQGDAEADLVRLIQSVTGADIDHEWKGRKTVSRSWCGGWWITANFRGLEGSLSLADYLASQDQKTELEQPLGRCYGASRAIGRHSRSKAEECVSSISAAPSTRQQNSLEDR